jgi:penicillin G amidase
MVHDSVRRAAAICGTALGCLLLAAASVRTDGQGIQRENEAPRFEAAQSDLFGLSGGQPNCWADFDNDGDLDLFVGMKGNAPNKLYRNDSGVFREVAGELGIADTIDTRGAAWGDYNGDGNLDIYVGFSKRSGAANKLFRNDGSGRHFTEVGHAMGVDVSGFETRQITWIDYDNDGNADLFVAFRDGPNMLFHNENSRFRNVAPEMGVDDARRTVGAAWFDFNRDGRLDLFVANQDGDKNGLWRNDGTRFVDVAADLGMEGTAPGRIGSNGPSVIDFNNDGHFDLFVAGYGRNFLYRNEGNGKFTEVAAQMAVMGGERATPSAWGDYDNDGRPDLYVSSYVDKPVNEKDYLYHNEGDHFVDLTPELFRKHGATHGLQWADYDRDGAVDLAVANNNPEGKNALFRNLIAQDQASRSLQVLVLDRRGNCTRAGSEVRIYSAGTRRVIGGRIVDSGSGYTSQSQAPVHFGLGSEKRVDVEVTYFTPRGRQTIAQRNVDAARAPGRTLIIKVPAP